MIINKSFTTIEMVYDVNAGSKLFCVKTFSISELEHLTELKAHTIRTWELRYGIPQPERSLTNVRSYSLDQLSTILQLALLSQNGYRISDICNHSPEGLGNLLHRLRFESHQHRVLINHLIIAMYRMDVELFEAELEKGFHSWTPQTMVSEVIFPFLQKTKLLVNGTQSTEEHLVVTSIRKKLLGLIERLPAAHTGGRCILLFLPGTRGLDLGLLYLCFRLRVAGRRVIYMGNDVSMSNIRDVVLKYQPEFLYTYSFGKEKFDLEKLSGILKDASHPATLLFTGNAGNTYDDAHIINLDLEDALKYLLK